MKIRRTRHYRWALWIGLTLLVLMPLLTWFLTDVIEMKYHGQDSLFREMEDLSNSFGYGMVIFTGCIFGPILEEFSFRFWGIGKRYAMIVSIVLMALFSWGEMNSILLGIVVLVGLLAVIFLVRDRNRQTLIFLIASSAIFSLMHISGFSEWSLFVIIGLLELFGFALLCSYLTINHNFLFAILLHCANNFYAFWPPSGKLSLETDRYEITANPIQYSDYLDMQNQYGDTTIVVGSIAECAFYLMQQQCHEEGIDLNKAPFVLREKEQSIQLYSTAIHGKGSSQAPDYKAMLRTLEEEEWITLDTTFEPVYIIGIADSAVLDSTSGIQPCTMHGIVSRLRNVCHIPAVLDKGVAEELTLYVPADDWLVEDSEEYLERLREDGLSITPSPTEKMKVITVSDKQ